MTLKTLAIGVAFATLSGATAMAADVIKAFEFSATLSDNAIVSGDLLVDVTSGKAVGSTIFTGAPDNFVSTFVSAQFESVGQQVDVRNAAQTEDFDFLVVGNLVGYSGGASPQGNLFDLVDDTAGARFTNGTLTAVPEPATWAIMLVGFGGLGAAMRARRSRTALA
jgi:hypothetical protein